MRLFLLFIVFILISCNGETEEEKAGGAGFVSIEGRKFLCLRDETENTFYAAVEIKEENRFINWKKRYDTKEACEAVIAQMIKALD